MFRTQTIEESTEFFVVCHEVVVLGGCESFIVSSDLLLVQNALVQVHHLLVVLVEEQDTGAKGISYCLFGGQCTLDILYSTMINRKYF